MEGSISSPRRYMQILDGTGAIAVGGSSAAGDVRVHAIVVHTALAGTLTIAGFNKRNSGGTIAAANFVLPVALAAGVYPLGDVVNDAGACTAALSSATDDERVAIIWQPNR